MFSYLDNEVILTVIFARDVGVPLYVVSGEKKLIQVRFDINFVKIEPTKCSWYEMYCNLYTIPRKR